MSAKKVVRKAVYGGTFDPPTLGHEWMIARGAELFDKLVIGVGINPNKRPLFDTESRLTMLRAIALPYSNVRVQTFEHQYLVQFARQIGATFMVRGLRSEQDFDYERVLHLINRDIDETVTTTFLMPPREIAEVSSSIVKGLVGPEGWKTVVGKYVNRDVLSRLGKTIIPHTPN